MVTLNALVFSDKCFHVIYVHGWYNSTLNIRTFHASKCYNVSVILYIRLLIRETMQLLQCLKFFIGHKTGLCSCCTRLPWKRVFCGIKNTFTNKQTVVCKRTSCTNIFFSQTSSRYTKNIIRDGQL